MRAVLDTSVVVAAVRSPTGASKVLLDAALNGRFKMLLSSALALEYEAVLSRPEHLEVSGFAQAEIGELLDAICRAAVRVAIRFRWRPQLGDPDDEMVLETAINGRAQAIVTFNRADFAPVATRFGLDVLSPGEALKKLEAL